MSEKQGSESLKFEINLTIISFSTTVDEELPYSVTFKRGKKVTNSGTTSFKKASELYNQSFKINSTLFKKNQNTLKKKTVLFNLNDFPNSNVIAKGVVNLADVCDVFNKEIKKKITIELSKKKKKRGDLDVLFDVKRIETHNEIIDNIMGGKKKVVKKEKKKVIKEKNIVSEKVVEKKKEKKEEKVSFNIPKSEEDMDKRVKDLENAVVNVQLENRKLKNERKKLLSEYKKMEDEYTKIKKENDEVKDEIVAIKEENVSFSKKFENAKKDNDAIVKKNKEMEEEIKKSKTKSKELKKKLKKQKELNSENNKLLLKLKLKNEDLNAKNEIESKSKKELKRKSKKLKNKDALKIKLLEEEIEKLKSEKKDKEPKQDDSKGNDNTKLLEDEICKLKLENKQLSDKLSKQKDEKKDNITNTKLWEDKIAELKTEIAKLNGKLKAEKDSKSDLKKQLKDTKDAHEEVVDKLKKDLEESINMSKSNESKENLKPKVDRLEKELKECKEKHDSDKSGFKNFKWKLEMKLNEKENEINNLKSRKNEKSDEAKIQRLVDFKVKKEVQKVTVTFNKDKSSLEEKVKELTTILDNQSDEISDTREIERFIIDQAILFPSSQITPLYLDKIPVVVKVFKKCCDTVGLKSFGSLLLSSLEFMMVDRMQEFRFFYYFQISLSMLLLYQNENTFKSHKFTKSIEKLGTKITPKPLMIKKLKEKDFSVDIYKLVADSYFALFQEVLNKLEDNLKYINDEKVFQNNINEIIEKIKETYYYMKDSMIHKRIIFHFFKNITDYIDVFFFNKVLLENKFSLDDTFILKMILSSFEKFLNQRIGRFKYFNLTRQGLNASMMQTKKFLTDNQEKDDICPDLGIKQITRILSNMKDKTLFVDVESQTDIDNREVLSNKHVISLSEYYENEEVIDCDLFKFDADDDYYNIEENLKKIKIPYLFQYYHPSLKKVFSED